MAYNFSAYASVRALLGVSVKELPDVAISDSIYASKLAIELADIDPDIEDKYATASALTTPEALSFTRAFDVFVVHAMSFFLLTGLPLFSPKSVTDGKAGFSRDSSSPYKETSERIEAAFDRYRNVLLNTLSVYDGSVSPDSTILPFGGVSSPNSDPVTG